MYYYNYCARKILQIKLNSIFFVNPKIQYKFWDYNPNFQCDFWD